MQIFALNVTGNVSSQQSGGVDLSKVAKPLGATIILFGLIILVFGAQHPPHDCISEHISQSLPCPYLTCAGVVRYFTTQSALIHGSFPVARNSIMMMAFVLASLVGVVFGLIAAGT